MKKIPLSVLVLNCLFLHIHGQVDQKKFGFRLGRSFSQIDISVEETKEGKSDNNFPQRQYSTLKEEDNFENTGLTQYHVGFFICPTLYEFIDVYWEILYAGKGGKEQRPTFWKPESDEIASLISSTIKLHYLVASMRIASFPGRINTNHIKNLCYILGLYAAYLVNLQHTKTFKSRAGEKVRTKIDLSKEFSDLNFNKLDLGCILGVGYEFDMGLAASVIANIGLRKILQGTRGKNIDVNLSMSYNLAKIINI